MLLEREPDAPAETTRRRVGSVTPCLAPYSATRRINAGEPNMLVTPKSSIASRIFVGSTCPGRVASISGMIAVMPIAGANRANSGNVQRSISSGPRP